MTIHSTYIKDKKLYSISMGKNFNLRDQKEFIAVYKNLPTDAIRVELDMKKTNHIDHSALSMMLVMNKCIHDADSVCRYRQHQSGYEKDIGYFTIQSIL